MATMTETIMFHHTDYRSWLFKWLFRQIDSDNLSVFFQSNTLTHSHTNCFYQYFFFRFHRFWRCIVNTNPAHKGKESKRADTETIASVRQFDCEAVNHIIVYRPIHISDNRHTDGTTSENNIHFFAVIRFICLAFYRWCTHTRERNWANKRQIDKANTHLCLSLSLSLFLLIIDRNFCDDAFSPTLTTKHAILLSVSSDSRQTQFRLVLAWKFQTAHFNSVWTRELRSTRVIVPSCFSPHTHTPQTANRSWNGAHHDAVLRNTQRILIRQHQISRRREYEWD